ncbi:MAG: hypothetical protein VXZ82_20215 [Planctomycetota bacterium]|nr:hypothetical protein [Planctomycetota bacterium]
MASEESLDAAVSMNQQRTSVWDMMLPGNWDVSRLRVQPSRITTKRILASTTLLAISLGVMKILTSFFAAVFVFPLWGAAIGCLIAGSAGAKRGVILSFVLPAYFAVVVSAGLFAFAFYAVVHQNVLGEQVVW